MGGIYSSKPDAAVVSPDDTKFLLGNTRHRRICSAYERISRGKGLDSKAFQIYVLGGFQMMPKFLADRIFFALDRAGKGVLTVADFVASMAVMLASSPEAIEGRYFLLFRIYDVFHKDVLERAPLKHILFIAYPDMESSELNAAVNSFFGKSSVLAYEAFRTRLTACTISKRAVGTLLTEWFYIICNHITDEPEPELVALEQRYNPERGLRKFASVHDTNDRTIAELRMRHAVLCKQGVSGRLDPGVFCQVVDSVIHEDLALRVFSCYTSASRLKWTILDYVIFCRFAISGSFEEQIQLLFNLFDGDRDGILSQVEVELMLQALAWHHIHRDGKFSQQTIPNRPRKNSCCSSSRRHSSSISSHHKHDKGDHLLVYGLHKMGYNFPPYDIAELARSIIISAAKESKRMDDDYSDIYDPDLDGLTLPEFVSWSKESGGRVQLLLDLCLIAAAEFHMKPMNRLQEKRIIQDICQRYNSVHSFDKEGDGFKYGPPGTWWAFISSKWWNQWCTFVEYDEQPCGDSPLFNNMPSPRRSCSSSSSSSTLLLPPGLINNHILLKGNFQLQLLPDLRYGIDYECLPPLAWECLQQWYGGGPSIQREVVRAITNPQQHFIGSTTDIDIDGNQKQDSPQPSYYDHIIEVHPLLLKVTFCNTKGHPLRGGRYLLFSKFATGQELLEHISAINKLEPERMRLWNYADRIDWHSQSLLDPQRTLVELGLCDFRLILVEVSQSNGSWPRSQLQSMLEVAEEENRKLSRSNDNHNSGSSGSINGMECDDGIVEGGRQNNSGSSMINKRTSEESQSSNSDWGVSVSQSVIPVPQTFGDGLTGMNNLGNTCYVSSSMQCLSHTPLLKDYFLNLNYLRDVNVENKMGQGGRLAQVFAELVQELWSPSKKTVTPKRFKTAIARFNDQFSGNDQHDAHDLLTFVLNGLNEDLNRIAEKPYIEQPDSDGRSDKELADIWWRNHLCRELSIVVALFGGQFKSLLTCQSCGYGSARFEPFLCLQLPLSEVSYRPIAVILVPLSGSLCPLHCVVEVPRTGTVWDIAVALTEMVKSLEGGSGGGSDSEHSQGSCFDLGADTMEDTSYDVASSTSDEEEELSAYSYLKLIPEDLVAVDATHDRIFSSIPMYGKLNTIKDKEVLYFYQLERTPSPTPTVTASVDSRVFDNSTVAHRSKSDYPQSLAGYARTQEKSNNATEVRERRMEDDTGGGRESVTCRPMDEMEEENSSRLSPRSNRSEVVLDDKDGGGLLSDGDDNISSGLDPWPEVSLAEAECATGVNFPTFLGKRTEIQQQVNKRGASSRLNQGGGEEEEEEDPHSSSYKTSTTTVFTKPSTSISLSTCSSPPSKALYYVLHRSLERSNVYFFNSFRLQLLDMPLVCSVNSQRPLTGIELYNWLASRFQRFIKDPVHISPMHENSKGRKLVDRPSANQSSLTLESFKNMDWSETCMPSGGYFSNDNSNTESSFNCGPTMATSAAIASGPVTQWGFRLTWVSSNGTACGKCNWIKGCIGCLIPPNNEVVKLRHGDTIAVDWHLSVMKERYDGVEAARRAVHSSVRNSQRLDSYSLSLERCMDAFTAEEIIPEGYCSKCKKLLSSKIKMDIWRLPPILVIQLKRFQYTNYSRMKLRNLVKFPINGLDLSPWIVKDHVDSNSPAEATEHPGSDSGSCSYGEGGVKDDDSSNSNIRGGFDRTNNDKGGMMQCDGSDVETESTTSNEQQHGQEAYPGKDGRDESLYDLYAVVHHLGALSAGHYVASVKDKDGVWHYFNDNQVYEMDEKNLVSPSAYILFYIRRDMRGISIEDVYPAQVASGQIDLTEIEAMMRQRDSAHCQVS